MQQHEHKHFYIRRYFTLLSLARISKINKILKINCLKLQCQYYRILFEALIRHRAFSIDAQDILPHFKFLHERASRNNTICSCHTYKNKLTHTHITDMPTPLFITGE